MKISYYKFNDDVILIKYGRDFAGFSSLVKNEWTIAFLNISKLKPKIVMLHDDNQIYQGHTVTYTSSDRAYCFGSLLHARSYIGYECIVEKLLESNKENILGFGFSKFLISEEFEIFLKLSEFDKIIPTLS